MSSLLFSPITLRDVTLKNRTVLSPMCQYSAEDGLANSWHLVHLGQFATGGFGLVFTEAAAVVPEGRITHGDIGIWSDAHAQALRPSIEFMQSQGAKVAIQLAHAGRKASMQRPWYGNGPLTQADFDRGDQPWIIKGASALPVGEGWMLPEEMSLSDIQAVIEAFVASAKRCEAIGTDVIEIHGAHGYLIASFLSPVSNARTDGYGGDLKGRMRLALETAEAVRAAWPANKPLFFRVSSVDGAEGGWNVEDSVALTKALKPLGVDVIDCSSGGIGGSATAATVPRYPGFQVPYAERIRQETEIATMAVGLILDGPQAEEVLQAGQADLIAIGREALYNPHWPLHAMQTLGLDDDFSAFPKQYGWWLDKRQQGMVRAKQA